MHNLGAFHLQTVRNLRCITLSCWFVNLPLSRMYQLKLAASCVSDKFLTPRVDLVNSPVSGILHTLV